MTDKTTRRELLRPLHLLLIALGCGVFAAVVTLISTGAFTSTVIDAIGRGTYAGLTPWALAGIVGGIAFIATLLILAMLILAVDPNQVTQTMDKPLLIAKEQAEADEIAAEKAAPKDGGAATPGR